MTVRDLRRPSAGMLNGSGAELEHLARCVDAALWAEDAAAPGDPDLAVAAGRRRRPSGARWRSNRWAPGCGRRSAAAA